MSLPRSSRELVSIKPVSEVPMKRVDTERDTHQRASPFFFFSLSSAAIGAILPMDIAESCQA